MAETSDCVILEKNNTDLALKEIGSRTRKGALTSFTIANTFLNLHNHTAVAALTDFLLFRGVIWGGDWEL